MPSVDFCFRRVQPDRGVPPFGRALFGAGALWFSLSLASAGGLAAQSSESSFTYQNDRVRDVPWSVHIAKGDRTRGDITFVSAHARDKVLGLTVLTEQIKALPASLGKPLAAVNGDFYQRENSRYPGDPRGLQIVNGEMLSAPLTVGGPLSGICFWMDAEGNPHTTNVLSRFQVAWPDGSTTPFGLNELRAGNAAVIYTPALGASTMTPAGGRELVLEAAGNTPLSPFRPSQAYTTRVREVRDAGNTPLSKDILVLSLGPQLAASAPQVKAGDTLRISTATFPSLKGATDAIGGGPALVRNGKVVENKKPEGVLPYELRSMWERHPRSAVGWSKTHVFLIEVDGRQPALSVGMTLKELGQYMAKLGCEEAMNLDGGGSAMFWAEGRITSSPCDGRERNVANSLIMVRKEKNQSSGSAAKD